jgi:hypothetical protein
MITSLFTPLFATYAGFLCALQILVLWASALGLEITPVAARTIAALAGLAGLLLGSWIRHPGLVQQHDLSLHKQQGRLSDWTGRWLGVGLTLWTVYLWLRMLLLAWQRPPYDWDGLYYHLPALNHWVQAGRVLWNNASADIPFVNYPMGLETITFWVHQISGTSRLVDASNLWLWPLGWLGLAVMAEELRVVRGWRWLTGGLIIGAPLMVTQAATNYVDTAFACAVIAAVGASLLVIRHRDGLAWPHVILWGACLGLMAGIKGTGLPFALMLFAVVTLYTIFRPGMHTTSDWLPQVFLAAMTSFAVGGYWYLRALIVTGNPIHPIMLKIGDKVIFEGWDTHVLLDANMPPWLVDTHPWLRIPVSWLQHDAPIVSYSPTGGLGYLWPAALLPAIVICALMAIAKPRRPGVRRFWFAAACTTLLFAIQPAPWWGRFTTWLYVLGAPCLLVLVQRGIGRHRHFLSRAFSLLVIVACCGLVVWESERCATAVEQVGLVPGTERQYVSSAEMIIHDVENVPELENFFASENIARTEWSRIGTLFGGVLAMPLSQRQIHYLPPQPDRVAVRYLQEAGVEWICWDAIAAGEPPNVLFLHFSSFFRYNPTDDVDFHFLKLKSPAI